MIVHYLLHLDWMGERGRHEQIESSASCRSEYSGTQSEDLSGQFSWFVRLESHH